MCTTMTVQSDIIQLNSTMCLTSSTLWPIPLPRLPVFANIEPPDLLWKAAVDQSPGTRTGPPAAIYVGLTNRQSTSAVKLGVGLGGYSFST